MEQFTRYNSSRQDGIIRTVRASIGSLFLCLLLATQSFAQVVATNQIKIWDDFSGGLNTKLSPFSLPPNQGDIVENFRFDDELRSLTKRDEIITAFTADATEPILGLFRLYLTDGTKVAITNHGDEIEACVDSTSTCTNILTVGTSDRRWQWLTWHNMAIGTDGYNQPVKYDGSSASATYLGSCLALDAESGSGPDGTYTYKVTFYTTSYEISFDQESNTITVSDNDIDLSMIPIAPDSYLGEDIIGRKIYRTGDGDSTYKLLSNGDITNNIDVTLTDSDADGDRTDALSPGYTEKPPKGKYIVLHNNRLFLGNNPDYPSRLYWSEDGAHDYFVEDEYFNIRNNDGDEITFLKNHYGILTVGKNNTIQKVYTDCPANVTCVPDTYWSISDPFSHTGCQAPYSTVNTPVGIMYLGNNGIYAFNGQNEQLVSDSVTPEIRDILTSNYQNVWAEYYKNKYYMTYTSYETGSTVNNRVLILDTLSKAYSTDIMNVNVFKVFDSGSDVEVLYSGASDSGKLYAHAETSKEVVHRVHNDFTGTWDDMRYIPVRSGGDANDPILELAWTETIDEMVGTIDVAVGVIDRPDTDGTYISQFLTINASLLDKLYWNEFVPAVGGDVTFAVRTGATTTDTATASWSAEFSNSTGSDISNYTADTVAQYRISMETNDIQYTPNVLKEDFFVVRMTFNTAGLTDESTVATRYRSGWDDFGAHGYTKSLKKLYVHYSYPTNTAGTLTITFENYDGDTDAFSIDLLENPDSYTEYFTGGEFHGEHIRFLVEESSLNNLTIKEMIVVYDVEPLI